MDFGAFPDNLIAIKEKISNMWSWAHGGFELVELTDEILQQHICAVVDDVKKVIYDGHSYDSLVLLEPFTLRTGTCV